MLGMEIPGLNPGKFFLTFLVHVFYPVVTALLEYLDTVNLHLFWFLLYNFVAVTLLLFKPSKVTAMMLRLCTHKCPSYSHI